MGDLADYRKLVKEMKQKYLQKQSPPSQVGKVQRRRFDINLTLIDIPICKKCSKHVEVHPHHKGHEWLFAQLLPDIYTKRYLEYNKSDCVWLCNKCHLRIHKLYMPRLEPLWPLLARQNGRISVQQAEQFRQKLIRCCNTWLIRKKK